MSADKFKGKDTSPKNETIVGIKNRIEKENKGKKIFL